MNSSRLKLDAFVTVVAPLNGERDGIADFVVATTDMLRASYTNYELLLVDSHAGEDVIGELVDLLTDVACIRVVRLSRPVHRDVMSCAGLDTAIGDYVVVLTPGVDPPGVVPEVVGRLRRGSDIVYGLSEAPPPRSPLNRLGAAVFRWYRRRSLGLDLPLGATDLVGLNRRAVNAVTRSSCRNRPLRAVSRQVGFRTDDLRYTPDRETARRGPRVAPCGKDLVVEHLTAPAAGRDVAGLAAAPSMSPAGWPQPWPSSTAAEASRHRPCCRWRSP